VVFIAFHHKTIKEYLHHPLEDFKPIKGARAWRLRRATSIKTGLLRMQGEILHAFRSSRQKTLESQGEGTPGPFANSDPEFRQEIRADDDGANEFGAENCRAGVASPSRDIALTYLRLANLDNELIDRLSRYEATLWRQVVQTLFTLQTLKRR
jgi:hypothetical protein